MTRLVYFAWVRERIGLSEEDIALPAEVPSLLDRPSGCEFHTRCPFVRDICALDAPMSSVVGASRLTCHFPLNAQSAAEAHTAI